MMKTQAHIPVLPEETIQALAVSPGGRYIDCTLGGGGHALSIMEHSAPGGQLLGLDADPAAVERSRERLSDYADSALLVNDNFANLEAIAIKYDFLPVHGILFDLGLSSLHLGASGRGFSFQHDAPLDMRFGPEQQMTAADIVNKFSETKLAQLLHTYGEETQSRQIAHQIVCQRPLVTTTELAEVVSRAVGGRRGKIHPATKTFQALRITVNRELETLETALRQAVNLLGDDGRLVVISYHSLEDRIVKRFLQREARGCVCPPAAPVCICGHTPRLRLVNRRVATPSEDEVRQNPRGRSAKLRAAARMVGQEELQEQSDQLFFLAGSAAEGWRRPVGIMRAYKAFSMS